ncbi:MULTISPECIES: hypothetical protein [Clostridium]|uniref:DUF4397 domain-containing protein n=1 Tax=Clostridium cibarium TaxID=2762247 RepID=A0ABR8PVI9_9CLOT|nr:MULTISPECIES: hypothetical protein [Clostridium]MBD7912186.1 hypothetical protein [Clostridium cibarium]
MGDVIFTREYQNVQSLSDYKIIINEKEVNSISNGSRKVISLKPGEYEIYVKCMGAQSPIKQVRINNNETLRLSCGSNVTGLKVAFSWLFMFGKKSLYLKETI